jgi:restriction system protein
MGRRRKKESVAGMLIAMQWWVSVVLGCLAYAALRWIAPGALVGSPVILALGTAAQTYAWMPFAFCMVTAGLALLRSLLTRKKMPAANSGAGKVRQQSTVVPKHEPTLKLFDPLEGNWQPPISAPAPLSIPIPIPGTVQAPAWSIDSLRALEWKRFELLTAKYYEALGFRAETIRCGADGGIDVKLFRAGAEAPLAIVQCKAWTANPVGVKEVRELLGVMTHEKVGRGIFITTGAYTRDALAFAAANPIQLLDGAGFLRKIGELPEGKQADLLGFAFAGDYRTPSCPSCGISMTQRDSKRGPFWGCLNYPRCRSTFAIKAAGAVPASV